MSRSRASAKRLVTIVADDYGIGPETSRGILDLANAGRINATVLLVNSPDAERAVRAWQQADPDADFGWHPNLTLDRPISSPTSVPSLVQPDGRFWSLAAFLKRVMLGRIAYRDVYREWSAQWQRFVELTGHTPTLVNSHQHVALFGPCRAALKDVLNDHRAKPYVRQVVESERTLWGVRGARLKRTLLTLLGHRTKRATGLAECRWLVGVTDHAHVQDERFWQRRFENLSAFGHIEVCCHPGYHDATLLGRDCDSELGLQRRPRETALLQQPLFVESLQRAGLQPVRPSFIQRMGAGRP